MYKTNEYYVEIAAYKVGVIGSIIMIGKNLVDW